MMGFMISYMCCPFEIYPQVCFGPVLCRLRYPQALLQTQIQII